MKKTFLYLASIMASLVSCGGTEVPAPANTPGICYVLCDFSASQGVRSRQTIVKNASRIFEKGMKNYHFSYYDIATQRYEAPFFDYTDSSAMIVKKSLRKSIDARKILFRDSLNRQMIKLCQEQGARNTCIMRTLDKIAASIGVKFKGPIKIFILSDMLEDCIYESVRINIDSAPFELASKNLSKLPKPTFTFKGYEIEVLPVVSSEKSTSFPKLFEFWKQVFAKYDYDLKSLSIQLPD